MDIANILLHLKIDGWHVESGIIPVDEVDSVRKSVEKSSIPKGNPNQGVNSETSLISKDQSLAPYLCHDGVLKVVESFIGQHFKISFTTAIVNNPGNDRGVWHSDWPFNQNNAGHIQAPYHDAVTHLTTIWMLSPFSVETGGTLLNLTNVESIIFIEFAGELVCKPPPANILICRVVLDGAIP